AGSILAFSPELYFIQKGGQIKYTILNTDYKTRIINNYIEANVLVKLRFGNVDRQGAGFHIAAGPYAGFAMSGKYVTEYGSTKDEVKIEYGDRQDEQDRMDYGLLFGFGVDFGSLSVDARWHQGLKNLSNNETTDGIFSDEYRNVGLSLSLGYYFNM
ncbi:MAG: porin family protein, partial [Saprospiraceae bacterium]